MSFETDKLAELAGKLPAAKVTATYKSPVAPGHVYLLAEHLDTVLAAGEDMKAQHLTWNAASPRRADEVAQERQQLRLALAEIRALELVLIGRVMRAREHAESLARADQTFRPLVKLFLSGTTPLVDAVAEMGDTTAQRFDTGGDVAAFLRSRGLIEQDAAAPLDGSRIVIGEDFRVAKRIPLGALMDLVAMFLDTLEIHYDLFAPEAPTEDAAVAAEAASPEATDETAADGSPTLPESHGGETEEPSGAVKQMSLMEALEAVRDGKGS